MMNQAWLIEYIPHPKEENQSPRWWTGAECNLYLYGAFTNDSNNAIKFFTQDQGWVVLMALKRIAEQRDYINGIGWHRHSYKIGEFIVTEHQWIDKS